MNNTLRNGLQLLEALSQADGPMGITQLAQRTGLTKSNVHRLAQTLTESGYVLQDDASQYRASLKMWQMGHGALRAVDVRRAAEGEMYRLLEASRETVHLSVLDGDDVVYLHKVDSPHPVRSYTEVGGRAPAACVATGKALLAFGSPPQIEAVMRGLQAHTATSVIEREAFLRELGQVRQRGYSVNRGEWRDGVWGVAAPIFAPGADAASGEAPVAAIGISGPAQRLKPARIRELAPQVVDAALAVTASMARR